MENGLIVLWLYYSNNFLVPFSVSGSVCMRFTNAILFIPLKNPVKGESPSLFSRWRNGGSEKLSDLPSKLFYDVSTQLTSIHFNIFSADVIKQLTVCGTVLRTHSVGDTECLSPGDSPSQWETQVNWQWYCGVSSITVEVSESGGDPKVEHFRNTVGKLWGRIFTSQQKFHELELPSTFKSYLY